MLSRSNYRILNQSIDFILGNVEDENTFVELTTKYRKVIFENKALLLRESPEEIIGIYPEMKGAGTSLFQKEDDWIINFNFAKMSLINIGNMLSIFEPIEKVLKDISKETGMSLAYLQENNGSLKKDRNPFLKEMFLTPPASLVEDKVRRLFQIRKNEDRIVYTFNSLNGKLPSLNECVALIQNERINAEEIFMPSLSHWLNSIKSPALVLSQEEVNSRTVRKKNYKN